VSSDAGAARLYVRAVAEKKSVVSFFGCARATTVFLAPKPSACAFEGDRLI
jgi:hypothetical protein